MKFERLNLRQNCSIDEDNLLRLKVMSKINGLSSLNNEQKEQRHYRANRELLAIRRQGRAAQFLAAAELVTTLREQYKVSPAAGVMASSYVNWALGITEIDPLEHSLLFERFMSEDDEWFSGLCIETEPLAIGQAQKLLQEHYGSTCGIEFQPIQSKCEIQDTLNNYFEQQNSAMHGCYGLEYQEDALRLMQRQLYYSPAESNRQRILIGKRDGEAMKNLCQRIEFVLEVCNASDTSIFHELYRNTPARVSKAWIVSRQALLNRLNSIPAF